MAEHHGPDVPDPIRIAAIDDAAILLLAAWDAARERAIPRLSGPQLNALLVVEADQGINLRGLAGRLKMILSSASRLCDRLVASGLVERVPGRVDRREIALYLTPVSRQLLEDPRVSRHELLGQLLSRMSPAGRAALLFGLTEFAAAAVADDAGTATGTDEAPATEEATARGQIAVPGEVAAAPDDSTPARTA